MTEGSLYALTLSTLSPTVPGGDTPCLTAGDARRANPWIEGKAHSPTPAASHSSLTSARLSYPSTLSVRHRRRRDQSSLPVHGFPLALARVSPAVKHGAPPPEALLCVDAEEVQWVRGVAQQLLLPMSARFPLHLQCEVSTKIRNTHLRILRGEK